MKTIVVTGATGFTGSRLAERLVQEGHCVIALVRPTSDISNLERLGIRPLYVNVAVPKSIQRAFETTGPVDEVFHLAASFRRQHADLQDFQLVNVLGTRNVLTAASKVGAGRIVHCSTVGVQGEIEHPPATEEHPMRPGDMYQQSKLEGEMVALELAGKGVPVSIVRPVGVYGPGDRRFLKLFRPIARRRMIMIGSGESLYHLTYVDDVVEGLVLAAREPKAAGEVFTIAGRRYTTLNELVTLIAGALAVHPPRLRIPYKPVLWAAFLCDRSFRAIGKEPPLYPRRVHFFAKDRAFSIEKAQKMLGYEPAVDLEEGLARTAKWYIEQGLL